MGTSIPSDHAQDFTIKAGYKNDHGLGWAKTRIVIFSLVFSFQWSCPGHREETKVHSV